MAKCAYTTVVDCDKEPFVPEGWAIKEHRKGGILDIVRTKLTLHVPRQQHRNCLIGNDVRRLLEVDGVQLLNACMLDHLLAHPGFIPEEWKTQFTCFWATIFSQKEDGLLQVDSSYVRILFWNDETLCWDHFFHWLGDYWYSDYPAAARA